VPGMALYLNCTSSASCQRTSDDITWMYSQTGDTSSCRPVGLLTDDNYIRSHDGGLVILRVNASEHTGTFYCVDTTATDSDRERRVVVEHHVTMSGQTLKPGFHSNASACVGKQPIMVATASTEHCYWLALAFVA